MTTPTMPAPAPTKATLIALNYLTGVVFVARTYPTMEAAERGAAFMNARGPWQARAVPWQRTDYPGAPWRPPADAAP